MTHVLSIPHMHGFIPTKLGAPGHVATRHPVACTAERFGRGEAGSGRGRSGSGPPPKRRSEDYDGRSSRGSRPGGERRPSQSRDGSSQRRYTDRSGGASDDFVVIKPGSSSNAPIDPAALEELDGSKYWDSLLGGRREGVPVAGAAGLWEPRSLGY